MAYYTHCLNLWEAIYYTPSGNQTWQWKIQHLMFPCFKCNSNARFLPGFPSHVKHLGFDELLHAVDVTRGRRQMQRGFLVHGQG